MIKLWTDLKRQLRNNKKKTALERSSILFISPAKSGRTWVRVMLSHVYHLSYGAPIEAVIDRDNFHRVDSRIPIFFFTHIGNEPPNVRKHITPKAQADKIAIALFRDPRDVAVSRFHHLSSRSKVSRMRSEQREFFPFIANDPRGLRFVIQRMNEMKRFCDQHPNAQVFHYEAFKRDTAGELARMLKALGHEIPLATVDAAVEFARFENLKKREAEGFFSTGILQPGDPQEPNSFKVRRGKVGGYLDDLLPEQVAELDRIVDQLLDHGLGYRTEERDRAAQGIQTAPTLAG